MHTVKFTAALILLLTLLYSAPGFAMQEPAPAAPEQELRWTPLEKGLELALLSFPSQQDNGFVHQIVIRLLRIDPLYFDFSLYCSRWEKHGPLPLSEWAYQKKLIAAINAGMFHKDGTSTGYMRSGDQTNNGRIVRRYGSFFVCGPRAEGIPRASVLDRNSSDWESLLPLYSIVIQNFRLMGQNGAQLWPSNGPRHAVSAVAEDKSGRILFLHCSQRISVYEFVEALNSRRELNLSSAMYMEGGRDASLLLRSSAFSSSWTGTSSARYMFSTFGSETALPNILGVSPR